MTDKKFNAATRFQKNFDSMINNVKEKIEDPVPKMILEVAVDILKNRKDPIIDDFIAISSPEIWKKIHEKDEKCVIEFLLMLLAKFNIPINSEMVQNIFSKDKELYWKYIHSFVRIAIHHLNEKGYKQLAEPLSKEWNIKL